VLNLDWTQVKAVDLLVLFQSFAPAGGVVKRVSIVPSDFGLQKIKEVRSARTRHEPQQPNAINSNGYERRSVN
jgi:hypothetical protein